VVKQISVLLLAQIFWKAFAVAAWRYSEEICDDLLQHCSCRWTDLRYQCPEEASLTIGKWEKEYEFEELLCIGSVGQASWELIEFVLEN
jgi:hypothetical protein